jgi:hypothetical protein
LFNITLGVEIMQRHVGNTIMNLQISIATETI